MRILGKHPLFEGGLAHEGVQGFSPVWQFQHGLYLEAKGYENLEGVYGVLNNLVGS
jgi:hypothetical protein